MIRRLTVLRTGSTDPYHNLALEELLLGMIRRGTQGKTPHPTSLIRERSQNDFWDRVQTYLENNVTRRLTLSDICRDNLVGRSYLQKVFRELAEEQEQLSRTLTDLLGRALNGACGPRGTGV